MKLLSRILPVENIVLELAVTSKKRVFEQAGLLFENKHGLERAAIYESLFSRERLGSTGLGAGIAVPHGRVKGLNHSVAAFFRLANPIAFEAPDGLPASVSAGARKRRATTSRYTSRGRTIIFRRQFSSGLGARNRYHCGAPTAHDRLGLNTDRYTRLTSRSRYADGARFSRRQY